MSVAVNRPGTVQQGRRGEQHSRKPPSVLRCEHVPTPRGTGDPPKSDSAVHLRVVVAVLPSYPGFVGPKAESFPDGSQTYEIHLRGCPYLTCTTIIQSPFRSWPSLVSTHRSLTALRVLGHLKFQGGVWESLEAEARQF